MATKKKKKAPAKKTASKTAKKSGARSTGKKKAKSAGKKTAKRATKKTTRKAGRKSAKKPSAPKKRGRPSKLDLLRKSMRRGRPRKGTVKVTTAKAPAAEMSDTGVM